MSILNCWVSPTRAVLAVDTISGAMVDAQHFRFHASKMFPVVHAPMLIAGRGLFSQIGHRVSLDVNSRGPAVESFDLIYPLLPETIRLAHEDLIKQGRALGIEDRVLFEPNELVAVGWSASRQRIEGSMYQVGPDGGVIVTSLLDSWTCGPGEPLAERDRAGLALPDDPPSLPELLEIARLQCDHIRARWDTEGHGGAPIAGGRLIVAEMLTGGRITIEAHALD